jgi:hypothetical protein
MYKSLSHNSAEEILQCSGLILLCIRNSLVLISNPRTLEEIESMEGWCFCDMLNKISSSIYELHSMDCCLFFPFITEHDDLLLLIVMNDSIEQKVHYVENCLHLIPL